MDGPHVKTMQIPASYNTPNISKSHKKQYVHSHILELLEGAHGQLRAHVGGSQRAVQRTHKLHATLRVMKTVGQIE